MFSDFSKLVNARFNALSQHELFVVDTTDLFANYLAAFPEGSNPMYRTNTEHDCSCCKNFIRNIGNVVAIIDGKVETVWDVPAAAPYDVVTKALADIVRQAPIRSVWRSKERQYGNETSNELMDDGYVRVWHHFEGRLSTKHFSLQPDTARGDKNTTAHVFRRGLSELRLADLDTVIDLASANNLLRGAEMLPALKSFRRMKASYDATDDKNLFVWANIDQQGARFRNTAIGSLLVDLADGIDLETAVAKYENKVHGSNYKRPTALVTPKMIEEAVGKIDELGLRPTLERRHARPLDISVNDVLFVNNEVQLKDSLVTSLLAGAKPATVKIKDATPISIADFLAKQHTNIDVLVEGRHAGNFVSLTTGEPGLFHWDSGVSWSYDGDVADSIKERVKAAGGNVTNAKLRVSLSWFNTDDLDLHCEDPIRGHISFMSKKNILDVDMNNIERRTDPVENMSWTSLSDGDYRISVNQYSCRNQAKDFGFTLEVENNGQLQQYSYATKVQGTVDALTISIKNGLVANIRVGEGLTGGAFSSEKWGIKTETLVPVDALMLSPNHRDGNEAGNKHWFFILRGAKNPDPVRGIYNEYLRPGLQEHRKVFELLGSQTKAPYAEDQLSGLGFSSTQRNTLTVVADGRAYLINF